MKTRECPKLLWSKLKIQDSYPLALLSLFQLTTITCCGRQCLERCFFINLWQFSRPPCLSGAKEWRNLDCAYEFAQRIWCVCNENYVCKFYMSFFNDLRNAEKSTKLTYPNFLSVFVFLVCTSCWTFNYMCQASRRTFNHASK